MKHFISMRLKIFPTTISKLFQSPVNILDGLQNGGVPKDRRRSSFQIFSGWNTAEFIIKIQDHKNLSIAKFSNTSESQIVTSGHWPQCLSSNFGNFWIYFFIGRYSLFILQYCINKDSFHNWKSCSYLGIMI